MLSVNAWLGIPFVQVQCWIALVTGGFLPARFRRWLLPGFGAIFGMPEIESHFGRDCQPQNHFERSG
jgi:hypothetical protein